MYIAKKKKLALATIILPAATITALALTVWHPHAKESTHEQKTQSIVNVTSSDYKTYSQLKDDDYDRMFIANMMAHHQGALNMAELALTNAKHKELKDMASAIIADQNKEITQMKDWQKAWGYPNTSGGGMQDHSSMKTMVDMNYANEKLKSLFGDEFDKMFLTLMTEHHQSAVNMAAPGAYNAKHTDLKTLTKAVVQAQTKEVLLMDNWQKTWGYTQDKTTHEQH